MEEPRSLRDRGLVRLSLECVGSIEVELGVASAMKADGSGEGCLCLRKEEYACVSREERSQSLKEPNIASALREAKNSGTG